MAYNPNLYNPYVTNLPPAASWATQVPTISSQGQQPINGLVSVTGMDGAKAYQLPPNSSMPLFDNNDDILYVKTTDGAGFPTIKEYRFEAIVEQPELSGDYVSRSEFKALENRVSQIQANKPRQRKKGDFNAEQPVSTNE